MIRVLVVDDHDIFRRGLRAVLDREEGITVVGEAGDGLEGVQRSRALRPDVVLMDLAMPRMDGVAATRVIREELEGTKVIILSMHAEDAYVFDGIRNGAAGYVLKDDPPEAVVKAIAAAHRGEALLSPQVAAKVLQEFGHLSTGNAPGPAVVGLTPREREILDLLARGYRNREIAQMLSVSTSTIKAHLRHIYRKLHIRSRVEAALSAFVSTPSGDAPGRR